MWCTNDVSFIFVVEWVSWVSGERGGQGGLKIEENKSARKKWHENGPKIEVPITPSSGKRRSLELYHTSRRFGGPHRGLGQSGVGWERPLGCGPKFLGDGKPYEVSIHRTRGNERCYEPLNNSTYLITL